MNVHHTKQLSSMGIEPTTRRVTTKQLSYKTVALVFSGAFTNFTQGI